jgi:GNAT superfamily N-acetyltransferase
VFRGATLLVHGELVYVFANPDTQTSQPVPAALREVLLGFEAGEAMLRINTESKQAGLLQTVAHNRFGLPVGAARYVTADSASASTSVNNSATTTPKQVSVDVVESLRGSGIGQVLLAALQAAVKQRGVDVLLVAADEAAL